ncbi:hypothetical protein VZT92_014598 [Zoarces viviparus]|uniref:Uncharacterized protein n=1 Tax=Zoarces viviparus TaxID=48416 RepID=A0AAW1F1Q5_ZOAVI
MTVLMATISGFPLVQKQRDPFRVGNGLTTERLCCEHCAYEATVKEKMKQTFTYRKHIVHDPVKSSELFTAFLKFLDIAGLIDQDFGLMFGDAAATKFLERWPTIYKQKVLKQSRGLTQTADLQDLVRNAECTTDVENGWDSDMSSILVLGHLLPPSPHGRKRSGKLSARQASDKPYWDEHLDSIMESLQPYLLAVGTQKSLIHKYFINPRVAELRARMLH